MKILIVDDEPHILNELPKAFSKYFPDREVDIAHSFPIAEKLIEENEYEIIMLDGMLSGFITDPPEHAFGYNLIPLILEKSKETIIIMISTDWEMRDKGVSMGAQYKLSKNAFLSGGVIKHYLTKEFDVEDI